MSRLSPRDVQEKLDESSVHHFEFAKELEYRYRNGVLRVACGEPTVNPENPRDLRHPILKIEFTTRDNTDKEIKLDVLKEFGLPSDWTVKVSTSLQVPAETYPEHKTILLAQKFDEILGKKTLTTPEQLVEERTKIGNGAYGFGVKASYNQQTQNLLLYRQSEFFDHELAIVILNHEIKHAQTNYSEGDIERRWKLRNKPRSEFTELDMEDYGRVVVEDEYQRNQETIEDISRLRQRGIDLAPDITDKELINELYDTLWTYERKLYPNMAKLEFLIKKWSQLVENQMMLHREEISSERIWHYLQEHGLHKPKFEFLYGKKAGQWLQEHDLVNESQSAPDAVLIFELPKPLAFWWWKGQYSGNIKELSEPEEYENVFETDDHAESILRPMEKRRNYKKWPEEKLTQKSINEWGKLYEEKTPLIWGLRDGLDYPEWARHMFGEETAQQLNDIADGLRQFDGFGIRINDIGQHEPLAYYYVWGWWLDDNKADNVL